jgi:hypothetical protein
VKGGTRVRDVVKLMLDEGLAFRALPSHDAQSIAGILSTDVHGTGNALGTAEEWGFVSQSVVGLKLIDGKGEAHECGPDDDLFKAVIGGVGAVGIISEVVVEGVERFNVEQMVRTMDASFVEDNLDRLLRENDHLSLYLFPFSEKCRVNTWNRTGKEQSFMGGFREFVRTSVDALGAAWVGNLLAYAGLLGTLSPLVYGVERGSHLVLESNKAFNRTIYHLHQELEFTVPFEDAFEACGRFIDLYERMYPSGLPYPDRRRAGAPLRLDRPRLQRLGWLREVLRGRRRIGKGDGSPPAPREVLRGLRRGGSGEAARGSLREVPGSRRRARPRAQVRERLYAAALRR